MQQGFISSQMRDLKSKKPIHEDGLFNLLGELRISNSFQ